MPKTGHCISPIGSISYCLKLSEVQHTTVIRTIQCLMVPNTVDNDIALLKAKEKFKLSICVSTIKLSMVPSWIR